MIPVPELRHISTYQAPKARNHMPRIIPAGRQDIEIFVAGRGFFEHEGRLVEVTPGMVLWHNPGDTTIYKTDLEDPYACIVVGFRDEVERPVPRLSRWKDRASFQSFVDQILTEYLGDRPDMDKLACYIYGSLCWQCQPLPASTQAPLKRSPELQRMIDWIERHYAENIDLEQLSDLAGISIPHLHTLFKQYTGDTPYHYIQARRLKEAKLLLASSSLAVKAIARQCGFRDVGNFCRVFKQSAGMTAQAFRLQHLESR